VGDYSFGFNGKELDKEGLGGGASTYDYGFRIYNAALGRFLSVDPLSKQYPWNSNFAFAENRVINGVDVDGLEYYFAADGTLLGVVGGSTEIRVVDSYTVEWDYIGPTKLPTIEEANKSSDDASFYLQHSSPVSSQPKAVQEAVYKSIWNREFGNSSREIESESKEKSVGGYHDKLNKIHINPDFTYNGQKLNDFYFNLVAVFHHEKQHDILGVDGFAHFEIAKNTYLAKTKNTPTTDQYKAFAKEQMYQYLFPTDANEQTDQVSIIYNTIAYGHNSTNSEEKNISREQLKWMIPFLKKSLAVYNKEFGANIEMPDFKAYEKKFNDKTSVLPR
jgi:RHS repeat-associated protein